MDNIIKLKEIGEIVKLIQDEHAFFQGERGDSLYLLLKGQVKVYLTSDFDGMEHELKRLTDGDVFGEMSMVDSSPRSASVIALEDTICLKIHKRNFEQFIALEPKYTVNLLHVLAMRYFDTLDKVDSIEHDKSLEKEAD